MMMMTRLAGVSFLSMLFLLFPSSCMGTSVVHSNAAQQPQQEQRMFLLRRRLQHSATPVIDDAPLAAAPAAVSANAIVGNATTACSICGDGFHMENPDAPAFGGFIQSSCAEFQVGLYGLNDTTPEACSDFQTVLYDVCGCTNSSLPETPDNADDTEGLTDTEQSSGGNVTETPRQEEGEEQQQDGESESQDDQDQEQRDSSDHQETKASSFLPNHIMAIVLGVILVAVGSMTILCCHFYTRRLMRQERIKQEAKRQARRQRKREAKRAAAEKRAEEQKEQTRDGTDEDCLSSSESTKSSV